MWTYLTLTLKPFSSNLPEVWRGITKITKESPFLPGVQIAPNWPFVVRKTVMRYGLEKKYTFLYLIKIQIFWEGHTNLAHLPLFFWHYLVASNYEWKMGQIVVAFSEYLNFTAMWGPDWTNRHPLSAGNGRDFNNEWRSNFPGGNRVTNRHHVRFIACNAPMRRA